MKKFALLALVSGIAVVSGTMALAETSDKGAGHYDGEKYAKQAKVSLQNAEATALAARPGEITDRELEKEKGGSGLRYTFEIKSGGVVYEVGVDAKTGAALEDAVDTDKPD